MTTSLAAPALPFPVTPRRPGDPEVDLTGFSLIHRAMRSGARLLAGAVDGIARDEPCTPERRRAVAQFACAVVHEIHCHHKREDDVLWPVIVASVAGAIDLAPLSDDHTELAALLVRVEQALRVFSRDAGAGAPLLAPALTELADLLDEHITEEEAQVFPIMREHVSVADFARCEREFRRGVTPGHLVFLVPWIADQCTAEEREHLLAEAGAPMRLLLRIGEGRYTRRRDLVRG